MYESFFQFHARPFPAAPSADHYFAAASAEHARETISRCIERAEGPSMIVGPAGTGKSTLCQVIAAQFRDQFHVAMLASARLCTRRALLQNILFELKLPYRDREEGELRLSLIDHLEPKDSGRQGMLLIIDEAHMLPLRLLEEVRMITNLVRDGQPRVRLVLAGESRSWTSGLPVRDWSRSISASRLAVICTRCIATTRPSTCGHKSPLRVATWRTCSTDEAMTGVYRATDGIPRLVNQVCDHALMLAAIGRKMSIADRVSKRPGPICSSFPLPGRKLMSSGPVELQSDILEFGALDDESCGELDGDRCGAGGDVGPGTMEMANPLTTLDSIESTLTTLENDYREQQRPSRNSNFVLE